MTGWQSIETAPQDGQARLYLWRGLGEDAPIMIVASDCGKWLVSHDETSWARTRATHWASLPTLPEGADAVLVQPAPSVPQTLTLAQLNDACMSMRHDYGLMTTEQREDMRRTAADWWRCFERALNNPAKWMKEGKR